MTLPLSPDELLTTTRAVRHRLDLDRDVSPSLIEECIDVAIQAPNSSNAQGWHFIVVSRPDLRVGLAELYRRAVTDTGRPLSYLSRVLDRVPVHVIPGITGRTASAGVAEQADRWASVLPATWSFMLAARARGLGTVWTTYHLEYEREAAALLGIPFDEVMQAALIPVAHYTGDSFRRGPRKPMSDIIHWEGW